MNDWQQEWWKQIEKTAVDMEEFLTDVGEATESLVDEVSESVGFFIDQLQVSVVGEVDSFIQDFVEVLIAAGDEIDAALSEEWEFDDDFISVNYHTPSVQNNPACINCANYHGQSYNGNLLVCAMHPHGYEGDSCPDWNEDK
jgi:hypothetical protein